MKVKNIIIAGVLATLFFIGSMVKMGLMVGSLGAHFSCMAMIAPLMGAFFGGLPAFGILGVLFVLRSFVSSVGAAVGLPTLFATLSWSLSGENKEKMAHVADVLLHVWLPLACMFVFDVHVSGLARCYALYWIIPVIGYVARLYGNQMIFVRALSSTFVAHAVGSVCWLLLVPMTDMQWLALIPVVALERFVYAVGMTTGYYGVKAVGIAAKKHTKKSVVAL